MADIVKKMVDMTPILNLTRSEIARIEDILRSLEGCDGEAEKTLKEQLTKILRRMKKDTEDLDRRYGPDRLSKEETRIIGVFAEKRKAAGISQVDIAKKMGTAKSSISRLERVNKHSPSLNTLIRYADAINCHVQIKLTPIK